MRIKDKFILHSKRSRRVAGIAFKTNSPITYLAREASVRLPGPWRQTKVAASYTISGFNADVEHGTFDTTIFREVFWDDLYNVPNEVASILTTSELQVMDLGGNVGYFAIWLAINYPDAKLTAIEADPYNSIRYQRTLQKLNKCDWKLFSAFATNHAGTVGFQTDFQAVGRRTDDGTGTQVPTIDVMSQLAEACLVKMDIEGGEWDILTDPRFGDGKLKAIVLEYHAELCPFENARDAAIERLQDRGFSTKLIFDDRNGGLGMLWGWRDNVELTPPD